MIRGGPAQQQQTRQQQQQHQLLQQQQQQKQKKRLSFKDPEIEGPQKAYGGVRPKNSNLVYAPKASTSVENLSLEDQALQIVQCVGSAFTDLSLQEHNRSNCFNSSAFCEDIEDSKAEALLKDCFLSATSYHQRSYQQPSLQITPEDQEFLEYQSPPQHIPNMRCPPVENSEPHLYRNNIPPPEIPTEEKYPSSAQHQIQLLKYQLDQQSQQTQLALHQVQLLTDQVGAENAARQKAQEQNNYLMLQNQELLNHIERLFQQIEDLEKQIQGLRREKQAPKFNAVHEPQVAQLLHSTQRRLSNDTTYQQPMVQGSFSAPRRTSITSIKPNAPQNKPTPNSVQQNSMAQNRRNPPPKLHPPTQGIVTEQPPRPKETLHIGDMSPPVQSGTMTPLATGWKLKPSDNSLTIPDRTRPRTDSFSSVTKLKPPENFKANSGIYSSNSSSTGFGNNSRRYSSSTSDLYNSSYLRVPSVV